MKVSELAELAEQLLEMHRTDLLMDPFFKINIEISEGDYISRCQKDEMPLSWKIKLHPGRHQALVDVQYSIVESLLWILFDEVPGDKVRAIIARLSSAFCALYAGGSDEN